LIDDYFRGLMKLVMESRIVASHEIALERRDAESGYVRGDIYFVDGSRLHLREFVNAEFTVERFTYAYHYQKTDGSFVFRYDRTKHFPALPNFPHHKHVNDESNVESAAPPYLAIVLKEIESLISIE